MKRDTMYNHSSSEPTPTHAVSLGLIDSGIQMSKIDVHQTPLRSITQTSALQFHHFGDLILSGTA